MADKKEIRYLSDNVQLMAEWDWERNGTVDPRAISLGSGKKVSWVCENCNNHWEATISNRVRHSSGCPFCAGKHPIPGQTDLESQFPAVASQWDYENNGDLKPSDVTSKSSKKVHWMCERSHRWKATVANRTSNHGCPYCAGKLPITGETDLATRFPHIASQWDHAQNGKLTPHDVTSKSSKNVWWLCEYGHSWEAPVCRRVSGHGCPICAHHLQKSYPETAIYYYVSKHFEDTVQSYRSSELGKMEFDIFIPSQKTAIEYDGKAYHDKSHSVKREERKYQIAKSHNVHLIRIREGNSNSQNCDAVIYTALGELYLHSPKYNNELTRVINCVLSLLKIEVKITPSDIEKDQFAIVATLYRHADQNNGIDTLGDEWDYERNAPLLPNMLSIGSSQKVYWKCSKGHTWEASVKERMGSDKRKGTGCPICSGNKVLDGFNDVATLFPDILHEWDYSCNDILPTEISRGYNGDVWWKCVKGHQWLARVGTRINLHTGCPYCGNKKVLMGFNDLQTLEPRLAAEWHPSENAEFTPQHVTPGSHKKVRWLCGKCDYAWSATVKDRVKGNGCPACANKVIVPGFNDLGTIHPQLTAEWDVEKNKFSVDQVGAKSKKKAWWKCHSCAHEWFASIASRNSGAGCPKCAREKHKNAHQANGRPSCGDDEVKEVT